MEHHLLDVAENNNDHNPLALNEGDMNCAQDNKACNTEESLDFQ